MNADERRSYLDQITERIIGCVHEVSNVLGAGFVEKVYENALVIELRETGFEVSQQHAIKVRYKNAVVGEFMADLLIENEVVVEIKATRALEEIHAAQCMNYLRATALPVCLLVNFGSPKATVRRIVNNF